LSLSVPLRGSRAFESIKWLGTGVYPVSDSHGRKHDAVQIFFRLFEKSPLQICNCVGFIQSSSVERLTHPAHPEEKSHVSWPLGLSLQHQHWVADGELCLAVTSTQAPGIGRLLCFDPCTHSCPATFCSSVQSCARAASIDDAWRH
jgi:hypothetical protein